MNTLNLGIFIVTFAATGLALMYLSFRFLACSLCAWRVTQFFRINFDSVGLPLLFKPVWFTVIEPKSYPLGKYNVPLNRRKDLVLPRHISLRAPLPYYSRDFDYFNNCKNLSSGGPARVFGETIFEHRTYSFPVRCSKESFYAFLKELSNAPKAVQVDLIVNGIVHSSINELYRSVYPVLAHSSRASAEAMSRFVPLGSYKPEYLEQLAFFSRIASLVYHMWNKDLTALVLLAASHPEYFAALYELFGTNDLAEIVEEFSTQDQFKVAEEVSESETVALGSYGMDDVYAVLPPTLKASPLLAKSVAFVSFLTVAGIGGKREHLPEFLKHFSFSGLTEKVIGAALLYQLLKVTWEGCVAFRESGKLTDLLGEPRNVRFAKKAREMLLSFQEPLSLREECDRILAARELLDTRTNDVDVGEILQLKNRLENAIEAKQKYLRYYAERSPPFVFFLESAPGAGKTTLLTAMMDRLAERDSVPRQVGDCVHYNIHDPFPVETCKNDNARYLVMNDIPSDYSNYQKMGMAPIEVVLQTLIDTAPFSPNGASIEAKERVFANIRYVFISSNSRALKCATDPEKVHRRVCHGALFSMAFKNGLTFNDTLHMSQAERNDITTFSPLKISEGKLGNILEFVPASGERQLSYRAFFLRVEELISAHEKRCLEENLRLGAASTKCKCGFPVSLHQSGNRCVAIFPECTVGEQLPPGNLLGSTAMVTTESAIYFLGLYTLLAYLAKRFWSAFEEYIFTTPYALGFIWLQVISQYVALRIRVYWVRSFFDPNFTFVAEEWKKRLSWTRFRAAVVAFVLKYWKLMLLALGSGLLLSMCQSVTTPYGPTFSRAQVDRESMRTIQPTSFSQYRPAVMRSWAVTDGPEGVELTSSGVAFEDLVRLCKKAMIVLEATREGKKTHVTGIIMSPTQLLVNRHYLYDQNRPCMVTLEHNGVALQVDAREARSIPNSEFVIVSNIFRPAAPNLWSKCLKKHYEGALDATVLFPTNLAVVTRPSQFTFFGQTYPSHEWNGAGTVGMCGTLVVATTGREHFILGAIAYGRDKVATGCSLLLNDGISSQTNALGTPFLEEVIVAHVPLPLESLKGNSEFLANPVPTLHPFGTSGEPTHSFKSSFKRSRLYDEASSYLSKPYSIPTKVGGMVETENGPQWRSAWSNTFSKSALSDLSTIEAKREAMRSYLDDLLRFRDAQPDVELHPLDMYEAFFGKEEMGIEGLPRGTSAGPGWKEFGINNKSDCFTMEGDVVVMKEQFRAAVDRLIALAKEGKIVTPFCQASPKDEIREEEKLAVYKIRLFSVLDAHYNVAVRMYVMPLIAVILQHPHLSECYGQMNAGSKQWTDLYNHLDRFPNWSDSDFSSFDACHSHQFLQLFALFCYEFAKEVGYTEDEATITYHLVASVTVQMFKYQSDYFLKTKGMPSGVIFTLALNSVINSILARMAFARLTEFHPSLYQKYVATATVGDDNLSTISDDIFDRFNIVALQPIYAEWGYVVTPAAKNGKVRKSILPEEATFVKRKFVRWEDGFFRAPIDRDVLYRPLCFESCASKVSSPQRMMNVYGSCVREAYLHGEEFFNAYVAWIDALFVRHNLPFVPLSFRQLNEEFLNSTFRTFQLGAFPLGGFPEGQRKEELTLGECANALCDQKILVRVVRERECVWFVPFAISVYGMLFLLMSAVFPNIKFLWYLFCAMKTYQMVGFHNFSCTDDVGKFNKKGCSQVFVEEIHKEFFGVFLPVAEFVSRLGFVSLWPFLLHLALFFLPFSMRIFFHLLWNRYFPSLLGKCLERWPRIPEVNGSLRRFNISKISYAKLRAIGFLMVVTLLIFVATLSVGGLGGPTTANIPPASLNQNADSSSLTEQNVNSRVLGDESLPVEQPLVHRVGRSSLKDAYSDFISQPVKIFHANWTNASSTQVVTENLLETWKSLAPTPIKSKFANIYYCRGKLRLTVVVQGAAQMYGQYVIAAYPNPSYNFSWDSNLVYLNNRNRPNSRIVPHLVVDPSKSGTYTLDLEMVSTFGWYRLAEKECGSYSVVGEPFTTLGTGTQSATEVTICIYASLVDVEFQGKVVPLGSFEGDENKWSTVVEGAGKMARTLGNKLPFLSPVTTVIDAISGPLGSVLKFLGFSQPLALPSSTRLQSTVDSWSHTDGVSSATVLGRSQGQTLALTPVFMNGKLEEMSVDYLCSIPFFNAQAYVHPAMAAESIVLETEVTPARAVLNDPPGYVPSALSLLDECCESWVGDLTYRYEFVCSVFHRATFLIAYNPSSNMLVVPPFSVALSTLENVTVEVVGNTVVDVTIPFTQPLPATRLPNGRVLIYLINPVVSNGSTDGIYINQFVYSDNIRFFAPNAAKVNRDDQYHTYTRPLGGFENDWLPPTKISFGQPTDFTGISTEIYGDVVRSIKDITSRMVPGMTPPSRTTSADTAIGYPPGTMTATGAMKMNWVNMWDAGFIGVRGSTKHSFLPVIDSSSYWTSWSIAASRKILGFTLYPTNGWVSRDIDTPFWASYGVTRSNATQSALDISLPMALRYDYRIPTATISDDLGKFFVDIQPSGMALQEGEVIHLEGVGDDYVYGGFIGFPRRTVP